MKPIIKTPYILITPGNEHKVEIKNFTIHTHIYEAITILEETKLYLLELLRNNSIIINRSGK